MLCETNKTMLKLNFSERWKENLQSEIQRRKSNIIFGAVDS